MKAQPVLIALIVGAALALPAALMPAARLEALVVASGLSGLIPAVRPPLGDVTRTLLAVVLGIAPLLVAVLAIAIARHLENAAEARAIADFEAAGAGRRLFRPAPLAAKRPPATADAPEPPSTPAAIDTLPEPVPEPEPAPLDLTGAVLAAPEELGSPPPEPMPSPPPAPLVEPESLRKPRPRPAAAASPAPSAADSRARLDQLEAMLGTLPPLPDHGQAPPPPKSRSKARAKDAATARDVRSGVVRGNDSAADKADKEAVFARLEQALAELRRLER